MRSKNEYVRAECVFDIRKQFVAYKRFKKLTEEWIELSIEASKRIMIRNKKGDQNRGELGTLK